MGEPSRVYSDNLDGGTGQSEVVERIGRPSPFNVLAIALRMALELDPRRLDTP